MNIFTTRQKRDCKMQNFWLDNFFYGKIYPVIIALVALISYVSNFPYFALTVFVAVACFLLFLYRDLTPFLILPMGVVFIFSNGFIPATHPYCIVLYCLAAISIIAHFIIYPPKRVKGKLFLPLLFISIALFLGGLGARHVTEYKNSLFFAFMTGPFLLFVYYLFACYVNPPKNLNLKDYFSYIISVLAVTISIEVFIHQNIFAPNLPIKLKYDIGWTNINGAASLLLLSIGICWYSVNKSKYPCLYIALLSIIYFGIFATKSDGCIGIALASTPFLAIVSVIKSKGATKRKLTTIYCLILLLSLVCATVLIIATDGEIINKLIKGFFDDNGRMPLYEEAISLFKRFPILGVGLGYVKPDTLFIVGGLYAYNFHSTFFHVCATMGIVGFLAYVYYFVQRFRILGAKNTLFNLFALISFIMYELYGMVDTCEFTIMPQMFILTILIVVVEQTNKRGHENSLPLKNLVC